MHITTHYWPKPGPSRDFDWEAFDLDTYDGAPDAGWRARLIGWGPTEQEAVANYLDQLDQLD